MINLNYLMDHILYQIFKIIPSISQNHGEVTYNSPIRIYANKIENRIAFKNITGYYLELLPPDMMKILGSTKNKIANNEWWKCIKNKITKNENGENLPHLEITEVVLVHCNIVNSDYKADSRVLYTFVPNISCAKLLDILHKNLWVLKKL